EGPRAVDVADRLGHRLGHVGVGEEVELHQGDALDVAALDVVDAVDVEEVVLVVVGEQPLHLGRVHAAVGLGDVDDRQVEGGEDVDLGTAEGQVASPNQGDNSHQHRNRMAQCKNDGIH